MAAAQASHGHNNDAVVFSVYAVVLLVAATYLLLVRVRVRPEATAPIAMLVSISLFVLATMATQHLMPTSLWWALAMVASQGHRVGDAVGQPPDRRPPPSRSHLGADA